MIRNLPPALLSWDTVAAIGEILWFPVYFMVIRQNYREKVCGMPLIGICAIFVQCFIYGTFGPYLRPDLFPHNPYEGGTAYVLWIWRGWLVVQGVVLVQFFLYHDHARNPIDLPVSKFGLRKVVALLLAVNLIAQWAFITFYHDYNVNQSDPAAYFLMSVGFLALAYVRPKMQGLSIPVAWLKMVGTALIYLTLFVNPAKAFGGFATLSAADPDAAMRRDCPMPAIVPGQTCGAPLARCEPMELICQGKPWVGVSQSDPSDSVCRPSTVTILESRPELYSGGWYITGTDTIFRSDIGELDLIRDQDPNGPTWCPQTTNWNVINIVDGQVRFHYEFPLFMALLGVVIDCAYIAMLYRRRRGLTGA